MEEEKSAHRSKYDIYLTKLREQKTREEIVQECLYLLRVDANNDPNEETRSMILECVGEVLIEKGEFEIGTKFILLSQEFRL